MTVTKPASPKKRTARNPALNFAEYILELQKIYARYGVSLRLAAGNAEKTLIKAEARLGFALEPGLRQAWRMANGSERWDYVFATIEPFEFLSLDKAIEERSSMEQLAPQYQGYVEPKPRDKRIRPGWYHEGWLPFASFEHCTLSLIQDYSPSEKGNAGQIIAYIHDADRIEYIAPDFPTFLALSLKSFTKKGPELYELGCFDQE
ncbi:MAG: SMI1/KNR4 family protein [Alphaproteobacteria bacterium]|nr:SMI1/KNR4 family protein [Alphaproteobacteria bacterium]